jgi:hypothetical protein
MRIRMRLLAALRASKLSEQHSNGSDASAKVLESDKSIPICDYSNAIAGAVNWLGDRYLLATPINLQSQRACFRSPIQALAEKCKT